jgi:hypothetical protein
MLRSVVLLLELNIAKHFETALLFELFGRGKKLTVASNRNLVFFSVHVEERYFVMINIHGYLGVRIFFTQIQ